MRRTFASQAEFDQWHEQAKTAAGLPIVGQNARTGEPQPAKQQTTEYTSLSRDEDGNLILEAVVGDDRLVQRGLTDGLIRADLLTEAELTELAQAYPTWKAGGTFETGDFREYNGKLYECAQGHTNRDPNHTPDVTSALWTPAAPENVIPEWTKPTGSTDAYQTDDLVTHPDKENTMGTGADTIWVWRSTYNGNDTEPGQDGDFHRFWEPVEEA